MRIFSEWNEGLFRFSWCRSFMCSESSLPRRGIFQIICPENVVKTSKPSFLCIQGLCWSVDCLSRQCACNNTEVWLLTLSKLLVIGVWSICISFWKGNTRWLCDIMWSPTDRRLICSYRAIALGKFELLARISSIPGLYYLRVSLSEHFIPEMEWKWIVQDRVASHWSTSIIVSMNNQATTMVKYGVAYEHISSPRPVSSAMIVFGVLWYPSASFPLRTSAYHLVRACCSVPQSVACTFGWQLWKTRGFRRSIPSPEIPQPACPPVQIVFFSNCWGLMSWTWRHAPPWSVRYVLTACDGLSVWIGAVPMSVVMSQAWCLPVFKVLAYSFRVTGLWSKADREHLFVCSK